MPFVPVAFMLAPFGAFAPTFQSAFALTTRSFVIVFKMDGFMLQCADISGGVMLIYGITSAAIAVSLMEEVSHKTMLQSIAVAVMRAAAKLSIVGLFIT